MASGVDSDVDYGPTDRVLDGKDAHIDSERKLDQ